jgi:glutamate/tyrosine decarboxylase-like PLP-dependent enzyme
MTGSAAEGSSAKGVPVAAGRAGAVALPVEIAERLLARAGELGPFGSLQADRAALGPAELAALGALAERLANTYPYGDPHYIGQILKPPHPLAWTAYATAMLLNPNNHALDGGPATATMEREAVGEIARMFGYDQSLGHLTSSGTIANLEALWVARELGGDTVILGGANAHYTHARMCQLIGAAYEELPQDDRGRIDLDALEQRLRVGGVGTVICTLGSTALGALDRLEVIAGLCERFAARLHVDAAYGGFFALLADGGTPGVASAPFSALPRADSIVVDPHKHGLQPYGCGCVLFADPSVGRLYAHDSPYTYFTSDELHLGEISLECSRAGAAAAALWATLQAFPLTRAGLGAHLSGARAAAQRVAAVLADSDQLALVVEPELDIICPFPRLGRASEITARCDRAFDSLAAAGWHVAKLRCDLCWLRQRHPGIEADSDTVTTLRCALMKPEHLALAEEIAAVLVEHLA